MKRVFCPKCDNQLAFDETKYPEGKVLAFVCPQCGSQFKIKLGRKVVRTESGQEKEVKEPGFSCGYITVIENAFGFKQELPLVMGDNVIGRRNKDTDGVDVPIITSDPSMGRTHWVIIKKESSFTHCVISQALPEHFYAVSLSERKSKYGSAKAPS